MKQEQKAIQPSKKENYTTRPLSTWADWCQVVIQAGLLGGAIYALSVYKGQLDEMKKPNRPNLEINSVMVNEAIQIGEKPHIIILISNGGPGVAYHAKIKYWADAFDDVNKRHSPDLIQVVGSGTIFAGTTANPVEVKAVAPLDDKSFAKLDQVGRTARLYFYGTVECDGMEKPIEFCYGSEPADGLGRGFITMLERTDCYTAPNKGP